MRVKELIENRIEELKKEMENPFCHLLTEKTLEVNERLLKVICGNKTQK